MGHHTIDSTANDEHAYLRACLFRHNSALRGVLALFYLICAAALFVHDQSGITTTIWSACALTILCAHFTLQRRYTACPKDQQQALVWRQGYSITAALMGAIAAAGIILLLMAHASFHPIFYIGLIGFVLCATSVFARYLPAYCAFILCALLPLSSYLLLQKDDLPQLWGGAFIVLMVFSTIGARQLNRNMRQHFATRQLNAQLRQQLQQHQPHSLTTQPAQDSTTPEHQQTLTALRSSEERLNRVLNASDMSLWDWDLQKNCVFHSHLQALLGYSSEQLQQESFQFQALIHPADFPSVRRALVAYLKGCSDFYRASYRILHANGHWIWLEDQGQATERDEQGRILHLAGTRRETTQERSFQQQARLAHSIFHNSHEGLFILDTEFRLQSVNPAFCELMHQNETNLLGQPLDQTPYLRADNPHLMARMVRDLERGVSWQGNFSGQRSDGSTASFWGQISCVYATDNRIQHYTGVLNDRSKIEQTQERLQYLAQHDNLTGLANRAHFNTVLSRVLEQACKQQQPIYLVLIDLDRFQEVNSRLGHQQGDLLLQEMAARLLKADLPCQLLARLSGDEFALISQPNLSPAQQQLLVTQIQQLLSQPVPLNQQEIQVSASLGSCAYPAQTDTPQELVSYAGRALRHAKQQGGNRHAAFTPDLLEAQQRDHQKEQALRQAVKQREFCVYFQPKLNLRDNRIQSAESLVRWQHPDRGIVGPDEFIELAERTGLIAQIGDQVLEASIQQASHWHQQQYDLTVAVNLSVSQLQQTQLPQRIDSLLKQYALPAQLLELELTESQLLENGPGAVNLLEQIRTLGVKISIDDFGTGYSSLSYLKKLPVDGVKIDRCFIRDILDDSDDLAITRAVVALAHSLKLSVTAEGVENTGQLQLLRKLGVDLIQGFFVSQPLPADAFIQHVHSGTSQDD